MRTSPVVSAVLDELAGLIAIAIVIGGWYTSSGIQEAPHALYVLAAVVGLLGLEWLLRKLLKLA